MDLDLGKIVAYGALIHFATGYILYYIEIETYRRNNILKSA